MGEEYSTGGVEYSKGGVEYSTVGVGYTAVTWLSSSLGPDQVLIKTPHMYINVTYSGNKTT